MNIETNSHGVNKTITYTILSDEEMKKIGFTNYNEPKWFFMKSINFTKEKRYRGFDITFDTMLRLSQDKTISQSLEEDKTEQLESKFEYAKKDSEGYINKGVYILEYQEDLTVKPVN